jgi:hypothetical protein
VLVSTGGLDEVARFLLLTACRQLETSNIFLEFMVAFKVCRPGASQAGYPQLCAVQTAPSLVRIPVTTISTAADTTTTEPGGISA